MTRTPLVSVLMGVYDAERYLEEAVDSLLAQTFTEFEIVFVDDGSSDGSAAILAAYDDPRIRILRNRENLGLPASLNRGLEAARAEWIARLDADDVAEPRRLERQVAEMRRRPELDVLGSWTVEIDERGEEIGSFSFPGSESLILWAMARTNVVYHPTVLMRRRILDRVGGYHDVDCADDYDLFTRILMAGGRVDILPERLVRYRRSPGQISARRVERQLEQARAIRGRYVRWLAGEDAAPPVVEASAALQAPGAAPPAPELLRAALGLQLAVREGAVARAERPDRTLVESHARSALLSHVEKLRAAGRTCDAAAVWHAALRSGAGWRDARVARQALGLLKSALVGAFSTGEKASGYPFQGED